MPKEAERYVCDKCKQEILIVKAGHCIPQCWGQEMRVKAWPSSGRWLASANGTSR